VGVGLVERENVKWAMRDGLGEGVGVLAGEGVSETVAIMAFAFGGAVFVAEEMCAGDLVMSVKKAKIAPSRPAMTADQPTSSTS
jgi:hypothetical protein